MTCSPSKVVQDGAAMEVDAEAKPGGFLEVVPIFPTSDLAIPFILGIPCFLYQIQIILFLIRWLVYFCGSFSFDTLKGLVYFSLFGRIVILYILL